MPYKQADFHHAFHKEFELRFPKVITGVYYRTASPYCKHDKPGYWQEFSIWFDARLRSGELEQVGVDSYIQVRK